MASLSLLLYIKMFLFAIRSSVPVYLQAGFDTKQLSMIEQTAEREVDMGESALRHMQQVSQKGIHIGNI